MPNDYTDPFTMVAINSSFPDIHMQRINARYGCFTIGKPALVAHLGYWSFSNVSETVLYAGGDVISLSQEEENTVYVHGVDPLLDFPGILMFSSKTPEDALVTGLTLSGTELKFPGGVFLACYWENEDEHQILVAAATHQEYLYVCTLITVQVIPYEGPSPAVRMYI
jgi:hypothetical protein